MARVSERSRQVAAERLPTSGSTSIVQSPVVYLYSLPNPGVVDLASDNENSGDSQEGVASMASDTDSQDPLVLDEETISQLVGDLTPLMWRTARRYGLTSDDAENISQEVFMQLLRDTDRLVRLRKDGKLRSYCMILVRNYSIQLVRREIRQRKQLDSTLDSQAVLPAPTTYASSEFIDLQNALQGLPDQDQQIIVLRFLEEMTPKEIANVLGISLDASKRRIRRARRALQERLESVRAGGTL